MHKCWSRACLLTLLATVVTRAKTTKGGRSEHRCTATISWMLRTGLSDHPERFPGLSMNSTRSAIQQWLHQTMPSSRCPDSNGSHSSPVLPSFTARLGLNVSQLSAYREMRRRHAEELSSQAFKTLSTAQRARRRRALVVKTLTEMRRILNDSQLALFHNRTAVMRRPPAMHIAASMWSSTLSAPPSDTNV